jgi:hypothetical protein
VGVTGGEGGVGGVGGAPDGPDGPEDPLGPEVPVGPDDPVVPVGPEVPVGPDDPEAPVGPEVPTGPDGPEVPVGPEDPGAPEGPDGPETPDGPEEPDGALPLANGAPPGIMIIGVGSNTPPAIEPDLARASAGNAISMGKFIASNGDGFIGVSNVSGAGSLGGFRACAGKTWATRFPQRVRASCVPSLISSSPLRSR